MKKIFFLLTIAAWSCGQVEPPAVLPAGMPLVQPSAPLANMQLCEDYTVEIEDRLFVVARDLEKGRLDSWQNLLHDDCQGTSWLGLSVDKEEELSHQVTATEYSVENLPTLTKDDFFAQTGKFFQQWQHLDTVRWEVLSAEFQSGGPLWGLTELELRALGVDEAGNRRSYTFLFHVRFVREKGKWKLHALQLDAATSQSRADTLFHDISEEAGIGYHSLPKEDGSPFPFRHLRLPYNGAACGDVNQDGIWDLFVSGKERNFLYLGMPGLRFQEVAGDWGVLMPADSTGSVFFDFDNDGDQDLAVAGEGHIQDDGTPKGNYLRLYRNDGDHFTDVSAEVGVKKYMFSYSVCVLDYDLDGYLDLYVCNYGQFGLARNNSWDQGDNGRPDALFHNLNGEKFEEVAAEVGVADDHWSFAVASADYDRDGDQDLYIAHDYARNSFFANQGDGHFKEIAAQAMAEDLGFGMGANWCDLNNDGLLDLYIANMSVPIAERILKRLNKKADGMMGMMKLSQGNTILLQQNDGSFVSAPLEMGGVRGGWAWGCAPNDFDLDGRLDVFCTNGYITRTGVGDMNSYFWRHVISSSTDVSMEPSIMAKEKANNKAFTKGQAQLAKEGRSWSGFERDKLWFNQGEAGFLDLSDISGADSIGDGRAAIAADFDNDGDLDLFLNEWSHQVMNRQKLLRNDIQATPHGFLKVHLRATMSQYQAVGAEVIVHTPAGPCSQVLGLGTGFLSCAPPELVFGIGEAKRAEIEVIWPGAIHESFGFVDANSSILLVEGSGKAVAIDFPRQAM